MKFNLSSTTKLFDSHCHLNSDIFDKDRGDIIKRTKNIGVEIILDVGIDFLSSVKAIKNSQEYKNVVFATAGIQPEVFVPGSDLYLKIHPKKYISEEILKLDKLIKNNIESISMIGECGIDLYWLRKNKVDKEIFNKSRSNQIELFERQADLAVKYNLPLAIHQRESFDLIVNVLKPLRGKVNGIFHSFTGNYEQAKEVFDLGFKIGINGIVTYKSASDLRDTIKQIFCGKKIREPEDLYSKNIYLETDSPFLGVGKLRGKRNEPQSILKIFNFLIDEL